MPDLLYSFIGKADHDSSEATLRCPSKLLILTLNIKKEPDMGLSTVGSLVETLEAENMN